MVKPCVEQALKAKVRNKVILNRYKYDIGNFFSEVIRLMLLGVWQYPFFLGFDSGLHLNHAVSIQRAAPSMLLN